MSEAYAYMDGKEKIYQKSGYEYVISEEEPSSCAIS